MTSILERLPQIIEAAIMVAGRPLSKADILKLFDETEQPPVNAIQAAISTIQERYSENNSGIELREVASGFQFQAKSEYGPWLSKLWEERPARYSRAFLETLALIAYRQPITRAEIEDIRGVTVSSNIIKTLMEREWIRIIGYKDLPGKPALYGTTKTFLDDFNLKALDQLPTLSEITDLEGQEAKLQVQLELQAQTKTLEEHLEPQITDILEAEIEETLDISTENENMADTEAYSESTTTKDTTTA